CRSILTRNSYRDVILTGTDLRSGLSPAHRPEPSDDYATKTTNTARQAAPPKNWREYQSPTQNAAGEITTGSLRSVKLRALQAPPPARSAAAQSPSTTPTG